MVLNRDEVEPQLVGALGGGEELVELVGQRHGAVAELGCAAGPGVGHGPEAGTLAGEGQRRRLVRVADDPTEAGVPRTKGATRTYETDRIRVFWDASRCIHTANCLMAQPTVFDVRRRPWVDVTAASAEEIAAAVRTCPTGAPHLRGGRRVPRRDVGGPYHHRRPTQRPAVRARPGRRCGTRRDRLVTDEHRLALCRCGASANKPFCDNSHRKIRFRETPPEANVR